MASKEALTFEAALAQLDELVRQLETGQLPLAESLTAYEQGIGMIKHCFALLKQGEQRVLELAGVDENGQPRLQPFLNEK